MSPGLGTEPCKGKRGKGRVPVTFSRQRARHRRKPVTQGKFDIVEEKERGGGGGGGCGGGGGGGV